MIETAILLTNEKKSWYQVHFLNNESMDSKTSYNKSNLGYYYLLCYLLLFKSDTQKVGGGVPPVITPPRQGGGGEKTKLSKIARKNGASGISTNIYVHIW